MYRKNHSHWPNSDRAYRYAAIGILLLAFSIRLVGLNKGIWLDEYWTLEHSTRDGLFGPVRAALSDNQTPTYYVLLKLWSQLGSNEPFLRLLSVFLNVGTVAVLMAWLKRYSLLAGILAGFFFAASINILRYSQELRTYALLLFATALSFYFASSVINQPARLLGYVGLAFSLTLLVTAHLVGIMVVIPIYLFMVLITMGHKRLHFVKIIPTAAIPCIVFLGIYLLMREKLNANTQEWWMPPVSIEVIWPIAKYVLGIPTLSRFLGGIQTIFPISAIYLGYIVQFLVLAYGLSLAVLGGWRRSFPFLAAALVFWGLMIGYSIFAKPIFWYRTILPGVIPLVGFVALHIATIRDRRVKLALIGGIVVLNLIFIGNWITNTAQQPLEEWQRASQILESKWQEDDLVIFYPEYIEGPVRYYWPDLPSEAGIAIRTGAKIKNLESKMTKKATALNANGNPQTVFLIIRLDSTVKNNLETYHEILSVLESGFGESLVIQNILVTYYDANSAQGNLVKMQYEVSGFLAGLESEFGQPVSLQEYNSFVWSTYYKLQAPKQTQAN